MPFITVFGAASDPGPLERAVIIDSVVYGAGDYTITFHNEPNTIVPDGNYDTIINDVDQNDNAIFGATFTRAISGLNIAIEQRFMIESRYVSSQNFPRSNEVVVPAQSTLLGFGAATTGGEGGTTVHVTNRTELVAAVQTVGAVIVVLDNDIDIASNQVNINQPNKTILGNGFKIFNNVTTIDASNIYVYNTKFDGGTQTADDALQINANGTSTVENIYLKNCDIVDGFDESLSLRIPTGQGVLRNITFDKCLVQNNNGNYGCLQGPGVQDVTYYYCWFLDNGERNIRCGLTDSNDGFSFEMVNCYIQDYGWATSTEQGNAYSVINCHYDSAVFVGTSTVDFINSGGILANTEVYFEGNYSAQGHTIDVVLVPYQVGTPTKSSGITPIDAQSIDVNLIGII